MGLDLLTAKTAPTHRASQSNKSNSTDNEFSHVHVSRVVHSPRSLVKRKERRPTRVLLITSLSLTLCIMWRRPPAVAGIRLALELWILS